MDAKDRTLVIVIILCLIAWAGLCAGQFVRILDHQHATIHDKLVSP